MYGKYKGVRDDFNNVLPRGVLKNGELVDSSDNELMIFIYEYNQQNEK